MEEEKSGEFTVTIGKTKFAGPIKWFITAGVMFPWIYGVIKMIDILIQRVVLWKGI